MFHCISFISRIRYKQCIRLWTYVAFKFKTNNVGEFYNMSRGNRTNSIDQIYVQEPKCKVLLKSIGCYHSRSHTKPNIFRYPWVRGYRSLCSFIQQICLIIAFVKLYNFLNCLNYFLLRKCKRKPSKNGWLTRYADKTCM